MKKLVVAYLLFALFSVFLMPAHASVETQATIDQEINVVFDFKNINSTIYNETIRQRLFNVSTIPETIEMSFEQQNLTNAICGYDPTQEIFNNSTNSIHVEFYLAGSDIVNFKINKKTMSKVYNVATDWRKFNVNLTDEISLNFTKYFGAPISEWQRIDYTDPENRTHPAYHYNYTDLNSFDPSFYFVLPAAATNVHVAEDKETIVFELPLPFEDYLINSPFLILSALIAVNIAIFLYRKVRK